MSRAARFSTVFAERKRRLRERSEHVLRLAAMGDVGRRYPSRVVPAALAEEGAFWRLVFVPLYRRVPWEFKRQAMRKLKMTAQGWPEQSRQFAEPWRPPVAPEGARSAADAVRSAPDVVRSEGGNGRSPEARETAR